MAEIKALALFTDTMLVTYALAGGIVIYRAYKNFLKSQQVSNILDDVDE